MNKLKLKQFELRTDVHGYNLEILQNGYHEKMGYKEKFGRAKQLKPNEEVVL